MFPKSIIPVKIGRAFLHRFMLPLVIVITVSSGHAQSPTDGGTPLGLAPGAPAGSYSLSDFERLNLYNGSVSAAFSLMRVNGRGDAGFPLQVPVQAKWQARKNEWYDEVGNRFFSITPEFNSGAYVWTYGANYSAGSISIRFGQWKGEHCMIGSESFWTHRYARTSVVFTAPDGTEHELVDQATLGQPTSYPYCSLNGNSRGTVFVSTTEPGMTFISDAPLRDVPYVAVSDRITGVLKMPDGTTYRFDAIDHNFQWGSWHTPIISWVRDPNGNKTAFIYTNDAYGDHLTSIKDSLNREITIEYGVTEAPYGTIDRLTFKGYGGANRVIRISNSFLSSALRPGSSIQTLKQLFPQLDGAEDAFDPSVVSSIWLPDSDGVTRRFRLLYNSYGELARVELPTGGAIEYDWAAGLSNGSSGVIYPVPGSANPLDLEVPQIYRRVVARRSYDAGNVLLGISGFSRPESQNGDHSINNSGYVTVVEYNPAAQPLTIANHYFYGSPATSFFAGQSSPEFMPTHSPFAGYRDGREYQTDQYALDGQTLLRRTVQSWDQNPLYWWYGSAESAPTNCPFIKETVATLADSGQVTKTTKINPQTGQTMIDQFGNTTDVWVYDYGQGQPGPLLRHAHTEYLTVNPVNGVDYTNRTSGASPHRLNLTTRSSVYDATGVERARTTLEYDNYLTDTNHAALEDRPNISGFDPSFSIYYGTRGNITASTSYLLDNGSITGSISAFSQYDIAGNIIKTIDGQGAVTTVDFRDNFGLSGDVIRSGGQPANTAPAELAGMTTYAFPFAVTNALGQTAYAKFDYYLGKSLAAEDANGIIARAYFNDALDRPTQVIRAANLGDGIKNQSTFNYDDLNRTVTTTTDQSSYGDNVQKSQSVYDGHGRTIEKRQYESAGSYITVKLAYDALGRNHQTSNPYRSGDTILWTTTGFDALSRANSVTTPDNATVTTSYSGNHVTIIDQAGKRRRSVLDASGRVVRVDEPDNYGNLDVNGVPYQSTLYSYDTLDSLVTVTQGVQTRQFVYDSLKRLVSTSNPESGAITYQYDDNGNPLVRTDARGVAAHFEYDALNRVTRRWYNGSSSVTAITHNSPALPAGVGATAEVKYFYDAQGLPAGAPSFDRGYSAGRLVATTYGGGSAGNYFGYDALGKALRGIQQTGGVNYLTTAVYNLAGAMTSETYPSGRIVTYGYDDAGRTDNVAGNLGDGQQRTYANEFQYTAWNSLEQERFGTAAPIYHKQRYNPRGQLWDMRASTVPFNTDPANGDRGAIVNHYTNTFVPGGSGADNNGNLLRQEIYIPGSSFFQDNFAYDTLNRLTTINEKLNGAGTDSFSQTFSYDRWGNRTISSVFGANINNLPFEVENGTNGTNRLYAPGDLALPDASRRMQYDGIGNLKFDSYTGQGTRTYDAENRMTTAAIAGQPATYTYDGDGKRIKRNVNSTEIWQVYGLGGELIAEYAANAAASNPQKEYGYRNGHLLVTTAVVSGFGPPPVLHDNPLEVGVTTIQARHITELRDAINALRSHLNLSAYSWQYSATTADYISANPIIEMRSALDQALGAGSYAVGLVQGQPVKAIHIQELRDRVLAAWVNESGVAIRWLVTDQVGTPRMSIDSTGLLSGVSRHDYLPFGEEVPANFRAGIAGYGAGDTVRQKFTGYEHDEETGLEFAQARYFASLQGRFTGVDPISGAPANPQTWNRYSYSGNSPLKFIDPSGMNYFMGSGAADPFIAEFCLDGFCFGPSGTNSKIEESALMGDVFAQWEDQQQQQEAASRPETQVEDPNLVLDDALLARIFGDKNAIARGASAATHQIEFMGGGINHTIHLYGDTGGTKGSGLYAPKGFDKVKYEAYLRDGIEPQNRVIATNSKTGEVIVFVHVSGVSSDKALQKLWKRNIKNDAGSRKIGGIGGPGGETRGYVHSHITFYKSADARNKIMARHKDGNYQNFTGYQDMRILIPRIFPRR